MNYQNEDSAKIAKFYLAETTTAVNSLNSLEDEKT